MKTKTTKLTPELQQKICGLIQAGNYAKTAALACGIAESTYYLWLAKGKKAKRGQYHDFYQAIEQAQAEGEMKLVSVIAESSLESWQAAAWMLERKFPQAWGRKERVEHSTGDRPLEMVQLSLQDWQAQQAKQQQQADEALTLFEDDA